MPKLIVILGAGASQALGLPSTSDLTGYVRDHLRGTDGCSSLEGVAEEVWPKFRRAVPAHCEPLIDSIERAGSANFEEDMNVFESLMTLAPSSPIQDVLGRKRPRSPVSSFVRIKSIYEAFYDYQTLINLMDEAIVAVRARLLETQAAIEPAKSDAVRQFFVALSEEFELRYYTFNFDTSIDPLIPDLNDGFERTEDLARFSVQRFLNGEGTRFVHLHGSVDFRVEQVRESRSEYSVVKVFNGGPPGLQLQLFAESFTQAGDFALIGSIITGLRKAEKTRTEPYGAYGFGVERDLLETPRVLMLGYGGSDIYFDHQLLRARSLHPSDWRCAIIGSGSMQPGDNLLQLTGALAGISDPAEAFREIGRLGGDGHGIVRALHLDVGGWHPEDAMQTTRLIEYFSHGPA